MDKKNTKIKIGVLVSMIVLAAASRLFPHPPNFTPIGAMALFGAAYFPKKWMAYIVPFLAIWLSSMILDNIFLAQYYEGFQWFSQPYVFVAFGLIVFLGSKLLTKIKPVNLLITSLLTSVIFFLVTNFGHWMMFTPDKSFAGLIATYAAGIPFFRSTILSDLTYVTVMFGAYEFLKKKYPSVAMG